MIEGIKKIREAFRKITAGLRKDGTINAHPGYESHIKEKLKEKEEVPGKAIMFVDGEKQKRTDCHIPRRLLTLFEETFGK